MPKDFAYVIEELITEKEEIQDKEAYYNEIIHTIIRIGRAPQFIIALSHLIQRLVIDHCILWEIFTTEAQGLILLWIHYANTIL